MLEGIEEAPIGFRTEDWMDIPKETGMGIISPPRITNILGASAILTIDVGED